MNAILFIGCVLCWGTTWVAITYQSQAIGIEPGIAWRFLVSGILLWVGLNLTKQWKNLRGEALRWSLLQSVFIACLNFVSFYHGIQYISSGMAALIFAIAPLINSLNNYIFFKQKATPMQLLGALVGVVGLSFIVLDGVGQYTPEELLMGTTLCIIGTYCFSLANMISVRLHRLNVSPLLSNTYAMATGGSILVLYSLFSGQNIIPDFTPTFWYSTLYLSIVGSVLGFTFYFQLLARVGSTQAAYVALVSPIVAALLASWLEGWQMTSVTWMGIALVLVGNWIGFQKWRFKRKAALTAE